MEKGGIYSIYWTRIFGRLIEISPLIDVGEVENSDGWMVKCKKLFTLGTRRRRQIGIDALIAFEL